MAGDGEGIDLMLHKSAFKYLKPNEDQLKTMEYLRESTREYSDKLELNLPAGPDKTFILRSLRTLAMWINVCITRDADGKPRE
jgi:hypothetical protein